MPRQLMRMHLHTCVSKPFARIMGACRIAGILFQLLMLKALAPHAVRVLGTYNSGRDDKRNETVEIITANCLNKPVLVCDLLGRRPFLIYL